VGDAVVLRKVADHYISWDDIPEDGKRQWEWDDYWVVALINEEGLSLLNLKGDYYLYSPDVVYLVAGSAVVATSPLAVLWRRIFKPRPVSVIPKVDEVSEEQWLMRKFNFERSRRRSVERWISGESQRETERRMIEDIKQLRELPKDR
jgi:hypothetical protein